MSRTTRVRNLLRDGLTGTDWSNPPQGYKYAHVCPQWHRRTYGTKIERRQSRHVERVALLGEYVEVSPVRLPYYT